MLSEYIRVMEDHKILEVYTYELVDVFEIQIMDFGEENKQVYLALKNNIQFDTPFKIKINF